VRARELEQIATLLRARAPEGMSKAELLAALEPASPGLTLGQLTYRLNALIEAGQVYATGHTRARLYMWRVKRAPDVPDPIALTQAKISETPRAEHVFFSEDSLRWLERLAQPVSSRAPVGYRIEALRKLATSQSSYLTSTERAHLARIGQLPDHLHGQPPASTYNRQLAERLLVDLSWASSHLEGNTYSLLETQRLIELGEEAPGHESHEALMILNHKRAIELMLQRSSSLRMDAYTVCGLHAALMDGLLPDPNEAGRLRRHPVYITSTSYIPPHIPQVLDEAFELILAIARAERDPFEKSLFVLAHLSRLQPFIDGNKRTSRLLANLPFIAAGLTPLSFTDLAREDYLGAMLIFYEQQRIDPLKELFIFAYERSVARYHALTQDLARPDPLRLRHRQALFEMTRQLVQAMPEDLSSYAQRLVEQELPTLPSSDQTRLIAMLLAEVRGLHSGNLLRYGLYPHELERFIAAQQR
jgi:Fic family protein